RSVLDFARRHTWDEAHARQVTTLALSLFDQRYHRKALPADRHADYMALDDDDRTLVRRLPALLRLAEGRAGDHSQVVGAAAMVDGGDHLRLELRARDVPDLAMWAAERNGDLFELEFGRHIQPGACDVPEGLT